MAFNKHRGREIIGTMLLFVIIFSTTSLLSYNSGDSLILQELGISPQPQNFFGMFGSTFAEGLVSYFGLGAFWIPLLLLLTALNFLHKKINAPILVSTITGGMLLVITTGSILSLKQNCYFIFNQKFSSGGLVGIALKDVIIKYYNQTGGTVVLILIWVIGFIITTDKSIVSLYFTLKSSIMLIIKASTVPITKCANLINNLKKISKENTVSIRTQPTISKSRNDVTKKHCKNRVEKKNVAKQTGYSTPTINFLDNLKKRSCSNDNKNYEKQSKLLSKKLEDFGVIGKVIAVNPGPVVTTFEYKPAAGVKINKIINLTDDLALALKSSSVRVVAPIPGKAAVGVEIPNICREVVRFREMIVSEDFVHSSSKLTLCLGKDIVGKPVSAGLEKMPHLLIAGATGTGKSVALNTMICSLLYKLTPNQVKLIMIDPKRIELSSYNGIPHLIVPVVTDMGKATNALLWAVREMENRYKLLANLKVKNIEQYNRKIQKTNEEDSRNKELPYIVIIIDELADLMMVSSRRNVEVALTRLAQMARASGIHLILATQRPSVNVLTGIIKANFPTRLTFQVSSKTDSRTIIDTNGAENLLGNGDMLFLPPGTAKLLRIHGAYISEKEFNRIVSFIKQQQQPEYDEKVLEAPEEEKTKTNKAEYDEHYDNAVALITKTKQASISMIQRNLRIGYNRAARIVEVMERDGIVGPPNGSKPREVLVKSYKKIV